MTKQLYDSSGKPVALPDNIKDAKRYGYMHYDCGIECPVCRRNEGEGLLITRKRYVTNGKCVHCALCGALEFFTFADNIKYRTHAKQNAHLHGGDVVESIKEIESLLGDDAWPKSRDEARERGVELFISDNQCKKHGHIGLKNMSGRCYYCETARNNVSPRQQAVKAGKKWYLPDTPCNRCNTIVERRVDNGQCKGCKSNGDKDGRVTAESQLMKEQPDLIMSRDDAKMMGFKVYRTGTECHKGHGGYRYVSTGNCIDCLKN